MAYECIKCLQMKSHDITECIEHYFPDDHWIYAED